MHGMADLLDIRGLHVNYGGIRALKDINMVVRAGEIVTLIGANGAGKTTTLRAISRVLNPGNGAIIYGGRDITRRRSDEVLRLGIEQVPEGRRILARLTVFDN